MAQTLQISISEESKRMIDRLVESGRYESADEVVASALSMLRPGMWHGEINVEDARQKIEEARVSFERAKGIPGHLVIRGL